MNDSPIKPTRKTVRKGKMANLGKQYVLSRPVANLGQKKSKKEQPKFPQPTHHDYPQSATTDLSDYRQPQPGEMIANVMKSHSNSNSSSPPNQMKGRQLQAPRQNTEIAIPNPPTQLKATSRTSLPMAGVVQPKMTVERNNDRYGQALDSITTPKVQLKAQRVGNTHQQPAQLLQDPETATQSILGGDRSFQGKGEMIGNSQVSSKESRPNKTGLPDRLKTGIENLSGYSMDDVRVHYNSEKPAQLQAHAFAQGTDIHVASGQEKHLPHEAWHVVQQMMVQVKPTRQMEGGEKVNDDEVLEKEADMMGNKALNNSQVEARQRRNKKEKGVEAQTIQRVARTKPWKDEKKKYRANKVGKKRLSGDALWLAMERFARGVSEKEKNKSTVNEVLEKAAKEKGLDFNDWKGNQKSGTSQEAQHLITSTFATQVLKLPYEWINSPENGKMLLAGRGGKGVRTSTEYNKAKKKRNAKYGTNWQKPARGILHIGGGSGFSHPKYSKAAEKLVREYYKKNNLTIGKPIQWDHFVEMTDLLRNWHKGYDRTGTSASVDTEAHTLK